jgi:uncharacterized membrane protein YeaQ/YmgE (transglycosylase-associated protein family)
MDLLTTIITGLIAGFLASLVMKFDTGVLVHLILGVAGSFLGGWISEWITGRNLVTGFNLRSIMIAFGGSIMVIFIYRIIRRK